MANCTPIHLSIGTSISFWKDPWLSCCALSIVFPCLFRLARFLDIMVADVWIEEFEAWDLHRCHDLSDLETLEWVALSQFLFSVRFRLSLDFWIWAINPSSSFSVKSLIDDLVGTVDPHVKDLYSAIWLDHFLRK